MFKCALDGFNYNDVRCHGLEMFLYFDMPIALVQYREFMEINASIFRGLYIVLYLGDFRSNLRCIYN